MTALYARAGTQDMLAYQEIFNENDYKIGHFSTNDVIIDIGAQIGCFAMLCLERGAGSVICFEPESENFALLQKNMAGYDNNRYELYQKAVWRSDSTEKLRLYVQGGSRTAMHFISNDSGDNCHDVPSCGLDEILLRYPEVRLCKLDCEGSEYPILYTANELKRCREIIGELHSTASLPYPVGLCNPQDFTAIMESKGFSVDIQKYRDPNLLFRAKRKD